MKLFFWKIILFQTQKSINSNKNQVLIIGCDIWIGIKFQFLHRQYFSQFESIIRNEKICFHLNHSKMMNYSMIRTHDDLNFHPNFESFGEFFLLLKDFSYERHQVKNVNNIDRWFQIDLSVVKITVQIKNEPLTKLFRDSDLTSVLLLP